MARISDEELEQLKSKVDLAALVRAKGIELTDHGANLIGRCPFHDDKTPSLVVTPAKNLWHCLGACQVGGSVIDWVMRCEGVSFRHAVEILRSCSEGVFFSSEVAGIKHATVRKLASPLTPTADDQELLKEVVTYYHETLLASPEALAYLAARGLKNDDAIATFKLGFANRSLGLRLPASNREAGEQMRSRLTKLGIYRESGHEHFNGSIVVPIISTAGEVTEMYARRIGRAKTSGVSHLYLPGPHRGIWNPACLNSPEVILCEALFDALTFWIHGFKNVTASYGTSGFTKEHLDAFKEHGVRRVLIAYDRDEAGDTAAAKLTEMLKAERIMTSRVLFPKGMDANEYAGLVEPVAEALKALLDDNGNYVRARSFKKPWGQPPLKEDSPPKPAPATAKAPPPAPPPALAAKVTAPLSPPPPSADPPADEPALEVKGDDVFLRLGEREYRVRGLGKNLAYDVMRINLRASLGETYHIDTLDLYSAKARTAFINAVVAETGTEADVIRRDLGRLLLRLEELQEAQIKQALGGETTKEVVTLTEAERDEALALLRSPDLLGRILDDLGRSGLVGEETNKLTAYLASVSRKLEDPLAVIIQSSSAAGKSSLMDAVLAMVPAEEKVKYSAMTGQSLFYMGEHDLKHKVLAIAEEEGVHQASYALKLLQSEGEISIASTGKDPVSGKLITHEYRVEGPVMIMLTTTAAELDEELLNRCLVLTVDEERAQTKAIHERQRERQTLEGLLARKGHKETQQLHQNAQRLLRPILVANPYATRLTFLDHRTRTRRDHVKYLTLIRVVTLLHQYQREVKRADVKGEITEYIEVQTADIDVANRLCHQVLGRSLDEMAPQTRRLLQLLQTMVEAACRADSVKQADFRFTRRRVRDYTGWSDAQLQTHLTKLTDLEYLVVHRGGRGQGYIYELLFDGSQQGEKPHLVGLIDTSELKDAPFCTYETDFCDAKADFCDGKADFCGESTPHLPPVFATS